MKAINHIAWDSVDELVDQVNKDYPEGANILCCWRGGVPIGIALSNTNKNHTLSVVKYQRLDADDILPYVMHDVKNENLPTIFVEDIVDSGKTLSVLYEHIQFEKAYTLVMTKYARVPDVPVRYIYGPDEDVNTDWYYFPWDKDPNK